MVPGHRSRHGRERSGGVESCAYCSARTEDQRPPARSSARTAVVRHSDARAYSSVGVVVVDQRRFVKQIIASRMRHGGRLVHAGCHIINMSRRRGAVRGLQVAVRRGRRPFSRGDGRATLAPGISLPGPARHAR